MNERELTNAVVELQERVTGLDECLAQIEQAGNLRQAFISDVSSQVEHLETRVDKMINDQGGHMKARDLETTIAGVHYSTETATLVADNRYFDGSNWERSGRNAYLYRGGGGRYFVVHYTMWQGERDYIEPVSVHEAKDWWDRLPEKSIEWAEAFGEQPVEA